MHREQIIPGLAVDDAMFNAAAAGLAAYAPGERITWDSFTGENGWTLIPDLDGAGYKAEFVVCREPGRTVKLNLWMLPDRRNGDDPRPHNHPWEFTAHVLLGGYTEQRYELIDSVVRGCTQIHRAGGRNHVPLPVFHEVTEIAVPGQTLTLMICGSRAQGAWGYLDLGTGVVTTSVADPGFGDRLALLNPRLR